MPSLHAIRDTPDPELLLLSAPSSRQLAERRAATAAALANGSLGALCRTTRDRSQGGRFRAALVARDREHAIEALANLDAPDVCLGTAVDACHLGFMFPGVGDHYTGMGIGLYQRLGTFARAVDHACGMLEPELGLDLRHELYPPGSPERDRHGAGPDLRHMLGRDAGAADAVSRRLDEAGLAQIAVFVVQQALVAQLLAWGLRPAAMIGYSLGEYAAAHTSGVLSLDDAARLIVGRARLIARLSSGAMLAVPLAAEEVCPWLGEDLSLSAITAPARSVVAGPEEAIAAFEQSLLERGHHSRRIRTTHAFHSSMMEPVRDRVTSLSLRCAPRPPSVAYVSNVSGEWITTAEATDPGYWARHLCEPVRFSAGMKCILAIDDLVLVEVGPGQALRSLTLLQPQGKQRLTVPTMRSSYENEPDLAVLLSTVGKLWVSGVDVDWLAMERELGGRP